MVFLLELLQGRRPLPQILLIRGTGPRCLPLTRAFVQLCRPAAWRRELFPLLELLVEAADHRVHPLPWALPVPLRVHGRYSRAEIEAAFGNLRDDLGLHSRAAVLNRVLEEIAQGANP